MHYHIPSFVGSQCRVKHNHDRPGFVWSEKIIQLQNVSLATGTLNNFIHPLCAPLPKLHLFHWRSLRSSLPRCGFRQRTGYHSAVCILVEGRRRRRSHRSWPRHPRKSSGKRSACRYAFVPECIRNILHRERK